MESTFFGLSLTYWSIPCLMMAVVWFFVWPSYRAQSVGPLRRVVLRWFHALTWFALALAAFLAGTGLGGGELTAAVAWCRGPVRLSQLSLCHHQPRAKPRGKAVVDPLIPSALALQSLQ